MRSILQPVVFIIASILLVVLVLGSLISYLVGGRRAGNGYWKLVERYTGGK